MSAALFLSSAYGQQPRGLWVLQQPSQIAEYDATTLAARRILQIPRRVIEHPQYLKINAKGQMLFMVPKGMAWGGEEMAASAGRVWFWDGGQAKEWKPEEPRSDRRQSVGSLAEATARQGYLSAQGDSLFWLEVTSETMTGASGAERSARSSVRIWRSSLAGDEQESIAAIPRSGWCRCPTGVCSESCPEWEGWAPDGVVGEFILMTRVTPGQLAAVYHESVRYQRSGRSWLASKLTRPLEHLLTASPDGRVILAAVKDLGCCGWDNESSDQMLLLDRGRVSVLFEEHERYKNLNYDVSFYVREARLSPNGAWGAFTIVSTAGASAEIRLASEGKANAEELTRIRRAMAELPAVEIFRTSSPPGQARRMQHAELIGWLSDREVLVLQSGRLVVWDPQASKLRETSIQVRSAADAFLR